MPKLPTPVASRKKKEKKKLRLPVETSQTALQRKNGKWKTAAECQRRNGRRQGPRNLLYENRKPLLADCVL
jgi:hypothetical protein